jgi:hypothetical protein
VGVRRGFVAEIILTFRSALCFAFQKSSIRLHCQRHVDQISRSNTVGWISEIQREGGGGEKFSFHSFLARVYDHHSRNLTVPILIG